MDAAEASCLTLRTRDLGDIFFSGKPFLRRLRPRDLSCDADTVADAAAAVVVAVAAAVAPTNGSSESPLFQ